MPIFVYLIPRSVRNCASLSSKGLGVSLVSFCLALILLCQQCTEESLDFHEMPEQQIRLRDTKGQLGHRMLMLGFMSSRRYFWRSRRRIQLEVVAFMLHNGSTFLLSRFICSLLLLNHTFVNT